MAGKQLNDPSTPVARGPKAGPEIKRPATGQREMSFAYRVLVEMIAGLG